MSVSTVNKAEEQQEQQRADQEQVEKVVQALIRKEKKGFERGEKKKFFESTGKRYGVSAFTVKNVYYDRVKKELAEEETKKLDEENEKKERKAKFKVISNEKIGNTDNVENSTVSTEKESQSQNEVIKSEKTEKSVDNNEPLNSEKDGVDKNAVAHTEETDAKSKTIQQTTELDSEGRPLKPPYKFGDIIQVRVDHITDFGAFCYTLDEYEYKGLLHISEIKNIFVENVSDYFEVGDIIDVKIVLANPNRLQFSTRDLPMKSKKGKDKEENMKDYTTQKNPPVNVIGEQFGDLKQKVRTVIPSTKKVENKAEAKSTQTASVKEDKDFEELMNDGAELNEEEMTKIVQEAELQTEVGEIKQEQDDTTTIKAFEKLKNLSVTSEREYTDIQKYLNNKIGALSPQAQLELLNILESNGVFKSSMAMSEVAKTFNVDYGLIFLNQVKSQLRKDECL